MPSPETTKELTDEMWRRAEETTRGRAPRFGWRPAQETAMSNEAEMDALDKIRAMQKRAADSGKHGYSSVFAEAAAEISRLRVALAKTKAGWRVIASSPPPDPQTRVIMGVRSATVHVVGEGVFDEMTNQWVWSIDGCSDPIPTHWMPLPEMPL